MCRCQAHATMIRYALPVLILSLGLAAAGAQELFPQFEKRVYQEGGKSLPYRLLVPKAYQPGAACPLIIWLHGSGEKGAGNVAPLRALANTPLADPQKCPAFVLVPQCPAGAAWQAVGFNQVPDITEPSRMVVAAVAGLRKEFGLDGRRIYVGGFSMGGAG